MPSAKDLVLRLRSITNAFSTDQPVRELDRLGDELRGTAREAATSTREVRRAADGLDAPGFDKAAAEAEATARRMRAAAGDMGEGLRTGARSIDTATNEIRGHMRDTGGEIGTELVANIAEGIGSGQANLTDVLSGTLGGLTNLAGAMSGPVALAAGAMAATVGLAFSSIKASAEKAQERIDLVRGAIDGVKDAAGKEAQANIFKTYLEDAQKVPGKIEKIRTTLADAGVTARQYSAAIAGDPAAIDKVRAKLQAEARDLIGLQRNHQALTAEQQAYLANMPTVLGDIFDWDAAAGATRREHEAINALLGKTDMSKARGDVRTLANDSATFKANMDAATRPRDFTVTIQTRVTGSGARLVDPRNPRASKITPVGI